MAIRTIQIATDSLDGQDLTEWETVTLSVDRDAWELHLSAENRDRLLEALRPFTQNEPKMARTAMQSGGSQSRRRGQSASAKHAPQDREAIARFVEERGLGTVGPRGRIKADFVNAWLEAGSPGASN